MRSNEEPLPILLVEDNEVDVAITERIFARSGARVAMRVARDGKEALDVLFAGREEASRKERLPALVLLDLRLPVLDGNEILRRLKSDPELSAIPVAVLTGASGSKPMLKSMALGGNMYFSKPISTADASELIPAVRKYWQVMTQLHISQKRRWL